MKKLFSGKWGKALGVILVAALLLVFSSSRFRQKIALKILPVRTEVSQPYKMPIQEALKYVKKTKMDTGLAIFINYRRHSGKKRLYIIDLKKKKAMDSFLVAHGCGTNAWGDDEGKESPQFSNEHESHCSSLGKYKIGKRAYSDWGINVKYVLYGLEATNNNAYKRTIVLHGWGDVADDEIYPYGTPEGWGCPAVSNNAMTKLDSLLKGAKGPVLLWAY